MGIRVVGKNEKLESDCLSWKIFDKVEKKELEGLIEVGNTIRSVHFDFTLLLILNFPTSLTTFQVHFNCITSASTFQLKGNFPISEKTFPTQLGNFQLKRKRSNFRLFNLKLETFQLPFPTIFYFVLAQLQLIWNLLKMLYCCIDARKGMRHFNSHSLELLWVHSPLVANSRSMQMASWPITWLVRGIISPPVFTNGT